MENITIVKQKYLTLKAVIAEREKRKQELEKECIDAGIDPTKLDEELEFYTQQQLELTQKLKELTSKLQEEIEQYESA